MNSTTGVAREALDGLLRLAGRAPEPGDEIAIEGADPVLPATVRIGEAGAAAIAAAGVAAADLWKLRTGRGQRVAVDVRAAAAAMRSSGYLRILDPSAAPPGPINRLTGFYSTRDRRWMYLHCNFPHHRAGMVALLECDDDPDAVGRAVTGWDAQRLEDAIDGAGLCGGIARTAAEWEQHPHAKAVAALPLLEVLKIGESAPEPAGDGERPLSGVRMLDLTRVLAGPTCGRTFAEHGADVLRIGARRLPSFEPLAIDTGHGKRSAFLDLDEPADHERLRELVAGADVFCQGYRPGALARRGYAPEQLAALRPGIVYVSLSAFGHQGSWRDGRGWDSLVQTVSGIAAGRGGDGRPVLLPAQPIDYASGYLAAFGAMVALARRAREGGSYLVRLSLAQTGRWISGLGRVAEAAAAAQPGELPAEELDALMMRSQTAWGPISHLAPAVRLSETPPRWDRPAAPLGSGEPAWLG